MAVDNPTQAEQNTASLLDMALNQWGLGDLYSAALEYVYKGYTDTNQIAVLISNDTKYQESYYRRFPALKKIRENNAKAQAEGRFQDVMAEPTPATYTALENGYRQSLSSLGDIGASMATQDRFTELIAGNVAVNELDRRINTALNYVNYNANDAVKQQLRDIYGLTDVEMAAYQLDREHTDAYLQNEYDKNLRRATVGGAAQTAGFGISGEMRDQISQNEQYGQSFANTNAQFQTVAENKDAYSKLASLGGQSLTTEELVTDQFGLAGAADVAKKKKSLSSQERARFQGSSGVNKSSLAAKRIGSA